MTRLDVKVGDKVRVVNPWGTQGQYKKGDVLTVRVAAEWGIAVEETYRVLLHDEYELYEPIKVGDTVTLIDKPWETDVWKCMDRWFKTGIMRTKNSTWPVINISRGHYGGKYIDCDDSPNESPWKIPLELLRKVDDGINAEWIATGVVDDGVIKGMAEPKKGDLFRVIGNDGHHMHSVGDVVEFLEVASERSYETYCPKTGRTQFVHTTDLEPYDGIHRHTPEQVAEAQRIIGEIVAGFRNGQYFRVSATSDKELAIRYTSEPLDGFHTITAHCSPHDEFNRTIGVLVALCKATGRKLPDWV